MAAVPIPLTGADGVRQAVTPNGALVYMGITVRETGGAAASVRIRVGSATGPILDAFNLAANDSVSTWYGPQGKLCNGALFEDFNAGAYEGSLFVA